MKRRRLLLGSLAAAAPLRLAQAQAAWPSKPVRFVVPFAPGDIPAIAETIPGYVATSWYGVGCPAGTPEPIVAKLEAAIGEALQAPDIQKRWQDDLGLDMPPPGRGGFKEFLEADRKAWAPAVKASGVRLD